MALRYLSSMFRGMGNDSTYFRNDQATTTEAATIARSGDEGFLLDTGIVQAVHDRSGALVKVRGQVVQASQATDQPLRAGQSVWVSKTKTGQWIIHGSV